MEIQKHEAIINTMKKMGVYLSSLSPKEKERVMKAVALRMAMAAEILKEKENTNV